MKFSTKALSTASEDDIAGYQFSNLLKKFTESNFFANRIRILYDFLGVKFFNSLELEFETCENDSLEHLLLVWI